ncbi:MAG: hypothetical protein P4L77_06810 [Sulfuriferula sp.]|nr:hypothetical protein [Sulfuriferula sp.]
MMQISEFMAQAAVSFGLIDNVGEFAAEEGWGAIGKNNRTQTQYVGSGQTSAGESNDAMHKMTYSYVQTAV